MLRATFDRKTRELLAEESIQHPEDKTLSELAAEYVNRMWRIAPPILNEVRE